MLTLLDLIFDNIFFVVVIFGLLYSFLFKRDAEDEKKRKRPEIPPVAQPPVTPPPIQIPIPGGDTDKDRDIFVDRKLEEKKEIVKEVPSFQQTERKRVTDRSHPKPQTEPLTATFESTFYKPPHERVIQEKKGQVLPLSFNRRQLPNQAVQGMMWSEVFGPPRALNPYRPQSWRKKTPSP